MKTRVFRVIALCFIVPSLLIAVNAFSVNGITSNSTSTFMAVDPGLYVVQIYAPDAGIASDPCGVVGGNWDTATATIEYTPDNGVTVIDIEVPVLVGATDDVIAAVQVGRHQQFRITVASVGAATCINFSMNVSQK